ncbi:uncharacterized protein LOC143150203 [Ptiloglossa arizonensis]|uniref:uncharacterized protein LOC143150203 n=1 Tax=Ptiloglossa arizonensis TaxID=3350558 RepID=UPI003FA125F0
MNIKRCRSPLELPLRAFVVRSDTSESNATNRSDVFQYVNFYQGISFLASAGNRWKGIDVDGKSRPTTKTMNRAWEKERKEIVNGRHSRLVIGRGRCRVSVSSGSLHRCSRR